MFLILSGEGSTDIGVSDQEIGPMTKLVDLLITKQIGYSLIDINCYAIFSEKDLAKKAKEEIKPRSKKGRKHPHETRFFHNNARALALLSHQKGQELGGNTPLILILFKDTDVRVSSERNILQIKWETIIAGFEAEGISTGVPMIPKPILEAWILCALDNKYQNCAKLENESGHPDSPNPLKNQLEKFLGEPSSRELINDKIELGLIDLDKITDMDSLTKFKDRLNKVIKDIGFYQKSR
jgi:hypothetical protein